MENDDENIHVDIGALRVSIQFQPTVSKLKAMRIREMIIKKRIACEKNFPYQYRWRIIEIGMKNMIRRRKGFGNEAPSTVQHAHISLKTVTKMRDKKLFHTHTLFPSTPTKLSMLVLSALVAVAVKTATTIKPNIIQNTPNTRPKINLGVLSP